MFQQIRSVATRFDNLHSKQYDAILLPHANRNILLARDQALVVVTFSNDNLFGYGWVYRLWSGKATLWVETKLGIMWLWYQIASYWKPFSNLATQFQVLWLAEILVTYVHTYVLRMSLRKWTIPDNAITNYYYIFSRFSCCKQLQRLYNSSTVV